MRTPKNTFTAPRLFAARCNVAAMLLLALLCTGCVTTKSMDGWIEKRYTNRTPPPQKQTDWLVIHTPTLPKNEPASRTRILKSSFLPALLYWNWRHTLHTQLSQGVAMNNLKAGMSDVPTLRALKRTLDGGSLDISIEQVPRSFTFRENGNFVFLLVVYFSWEHIYIRPDEEALVVSYTYRKGSAEKTGTVRINGFDRERHLRAFQSMRKLTLKYLDEYDNNTRTAGRLVLNKIISELQAGGLANAPLP